MQTHDDILQQEPNSINASESEKVHSYSKHYSETNFWSKIVKSFKQKGYKIAETALTLYYSYKDNETPKWAKRVILGALGYFILPLDAIPDFIPGIGYADDITTILAAVSVVAFHIKEEHKIKAKEKFNTLFNKHNNHED